MCLFCDIAQKKIPAEIIYEDEEALSFLDIHPRAPGHAVIISKTHSENILDLPEEKVGSLFKAVKKITSLIDQAFKPDGFTIGINHGKVSGQAVEHLHVHIIPRWLNDGGGSLHGVVNNPPSESLKEIKSKIIQS